MQSQKEYNELQTLRKKDIDMQREKYEEAMRHLREDKEKEIEDLKAQSKAKADENHELQGLCEKKSAEMSAFQAQIKDELEEQRLKTQQAERKCESLEKQLSGGNAGMKDLEDRLKKVSEFLFILVIFKQLTHPCRWNWSCQQRRKPRTWLRSNYCRRKKRQRKPEKRKQQLRNSCQSRRKPEKQHSRSSMIF
jgi:hypothetical protein